MFEKARPRLAAPKATLRGETADCKHNLPSCEMLQASHSRLVVSLSFAVATTGLVSTRASEATSLDVEGKRHACVGGREGQNFK